MKEKFDNEVANSSKAKSDVSVNDMPVKKAFFTYLFPSIFATLTTSIYVLFDTIMIGQYEGDMGILALNIVLPLYSLTMAIGILFGIGGGVLYSVARGKGEDKSARHAFTASFTGMVVLLVLVMTLSNVFFTPLMRLLGADDHSMPLVSEYGRFVTWGMPLFTLAMFLQAFIRNDKNPRLAMIGVIAGGVTNVVLDYVFVFPMEMGMAGAALATVVSYALNCLVLSTHFLRKKSGLKFSFGFSLKLVLTCAVGGVSSFVAELAAGIVIFVFNLVLLSYLADAGVVVYGVISNVIIIAMSLFNGIAQTCQPIVSAAYGAGKTDRIRAVTRMGLIAAAITGVLLCGLVQISPQFIVGLFTSSPAPIVLEMINFAARVHFIGLIPMCFSVFFIVLFQSVVRARSAFAVSMLRGVILPVAFVLVLPLMFGSSAVWFAVPVAELVTMGLAIVLYKMPVKPKRVQSANVGL